MFMSINLSVPLEGRSPHGERGLKYSEIGSKECVPSRSPHGERGLKYKILGGELVGFGSLSSWRAWIEMSIGFTGEFVVCRSPHGERGLKCGWLHSWVCKDCRSPHGERGLKFLAVCRG